MIDRSGACHVALPYSAVAHVLRQALRLQLPLARVLSASTFSMQALAQWQSRVAIKDTPRDSGSIPERLPRL